MFYTFITIFTAIILLPQCLSTNYLYSIEEHHLELIKKGGYAETCKCNFTLLSPKKIINPYADAIQNFVQPKPFGNICLKCAACLAIANEFLNVIDNDLKSNTKREDISKNLQQLCNNGFKSFDLRNYQGKKIITGNWKCTEQIPVVHSEFGSSWTKKLREICNSYYTHLNMNDIFNVNGTTSSEQLVQILCNRDHGIFRDCKNIDYDPEEILEDLTHCYKCGCS